MKCGPVNTPIGSACIFGLLFRAGGDCARLVCAVSVDGKIRAIHATEIASIAFFWLYRVWWVITLGVECSRKRENLAGTELNAETAGLTSFHNY
jgi:hypothetical protein